MRWCRDRWRPSPTDWRRLPARRVQAECIGRRTRWCEGEDRLGSPRAHACGGRRRAGAAAGAALPLDECAVLANQQIEMIALLVGKLEKDLLAFGVFEPFAVLLEEAMRATLAADPDHQRLLIVDAAHQPVGAFGEEAIRGALEEQERRARLELRIAAQQLGVPRLELAEMFLLLQGEILKHLPPSGVLRDTRGPRIKVEAAALGGDGDAQSVPRKDQIGVAAFERRGASGAALFTGAIDLDDALRRRKISGRRHFLDEAFDIGAEKLVRAVTALANEMEMTRLAIRMLEAEPALAEIDLARDAGVDHPLQCAVDGRAADAMVFLADQIDEIVGADRKSTRLNCS